MFAARDDVLVVEVAATEVANQAEEHACPLIVAHHRGRVGARPRLRELHPSVPGLGEHLEGMQRRRRTALVEPEQQAVEGLFQGQGTRLVDDSESALELQYAHRPPAAMRIGEIRLDPRQPSNGTACGERLRQLLAVGMDPPQQLIGSVDPAGDTGAE